MDLVESTARNTAASTVENHAGIPQAHIAASGLPLSSLAPDSAHDPSPMCITCSDVAVRVEIVQLAIAGDPTRALVRAGDGGTEEIDITLVQPVEIGDWVLAHAKTAIAKV
ncbi:MAG: HypC/HybG/HupF family hydrogenase formation chaperone [Arcanobacterium sp.]|nr:HypC/HybG/HupF family hydrogenase formation chaperone [Arcanobacterium sp.]MDY5588797.1 HypC/HybG/HupF family hydrogenase formation chaperone [Arcanobacterium sp.]